jgi:hypothetical protein
MRLWRERRTCSIFGVLKPGFEYLLITPFPSRCSSRPQAPTSPNVVVQPRLVSRLSPGIEPAFADRGSANIAVQVQSLHSRPR